MKLNVLFEYNFYSLFCLYFHIQGTDLVVDNFLGVQTVNQVKANLHHPLHFFYHFQIMSESCHQT